MLLHPARQRFEGNLACRPERQRHFLNEERFLFEHFSGLVNPLADIANRRVATEARNECLLLQKELKVLAFFRISAGGSAG